MRPPVASASNEASASRYGRALHRLLASPTLPKLGLDRMRALCAALGDPQARVPTLHIAGTKGKGSTAALSASILREAGLRTGLTTSPHLLCARERIVVEGVLVDEDVFADLEERVHRAAATLDPALQTPSFFERTIAMALCAFADARVDVAIVEVGLGGRLDATNVVVPRACAITRLGLDHQEFLGDTLALIAREKAGIMKRGVPVVTIAQEPEAAAVLADVARSVGAPLTVVDVDPALRPALRGAHQRENASLAVALARAGGFSVDGAAVRRGLAVARWPGRYERFVGDGGVGVILDGAHNVDAAHALSRALDDDRAVGPRHFVLGMSTGHDPRRFVDALLPGAASVIVTRARQPRAQAAAPIARCASRFAAVDVIDDVAAAVGIAARRAARDGGSVIVTGSLFVVGEARALFVDMPRDPARPAY